MLKVRSLSSGSLAENGLVLASPELTVKLKSLTVGGELAGVFVMIEPSLRLKKMLSEHLIFILPSDVSTSGISTDWEPSLLVPEVMVVANVDPLSVENKMSTVAQLTGALDVFATFQVIVLNVLLGQLVLLVCDVTAKGPDDVVTVNCASSEVTAPFPSRTVSLKLRDLLVEGSTEPVGGAELLTNVLNSGNVLTGFVEGVNDRKMGPFPLSIPGAEASPRSCCSQL